MYRMRCLYGFVHAGSERQSHVFRSPEMYALVDKPTLAQSITAVITFQQSEAGTHSISYLKE